MQTYDGYLPDRYLRADAPFKLTKRVASRAAHTAALERADRDANTIGTGERVLPKQIVDTKTPSLQELYAWRKAFRENRSKKSDYLQLRRQQTAEAMSQLDRERSSYMNPAERRMHRALGVLE